MYPVTGASGGAILNPCEKNRLFLQPQKRYQSINFLPVTKYQHNWLFLSRAKAIFDWVTS